MSQRKPAARTGRTASSRPSQPATPQRAIRWWAIGAGVGALLVVLLVIISGGPPRQQPTAPTATPGNAATSVIGTISAASPGLGGGATPPPHNGAPAPALVSPANDATVDSLTAIVTFTWQKVSDNGATYNLEFQYSDDSNSWVKSENVYGILDTSYPRSNPFLAYHYVRWRVWATTPSGDSDKSGWRRLLLPVQ